MTLSKIKTKTYNKNKKIKFGLITCPGPKLKKVYALYDNIFQLPEEKASYASFVETLKVNSYKKLHEEIGRYEEAWIYAEDQNRKLIGAVNFVVYDLQDKFKTHKNTGSAHIIYVFVDPKHRKKGLGTKLLTALERYSKSFVLGEKKKIMKLPSKETDLHFFCEQNDPKKMTAKQYKLDSKASGIDPKTRLNWWSKRGFKQLNYDYVQPPLAVNENPCSYMNLHQKTELNKVPSKIVHEHLKRFFLTSIFHGHVLNEHEKYLNQLRDIENTKYVFTKNN